jgi:hypothetical protein
MSAAASIPEPTTQPSRSARLLDLVRKLIEHGREIADTIRRRAFTDPDPVRCCFGTTDIAHILACIARGLHRANALEARIVRSAARLDAAPASLEASSLDAPSLDPLGAACARRPRTPRPAATAPTADMPVADKVDPRLARMPTPAQIAADVRRRPIGAVIADICRDLGILPSHPLWREVQVAIIRHGGNLGRLTMDVTKRAINAVTATWPPGMTLEWPAPDPPFRPAPRIIGPP